MLDPTSETILLAVHERKTIREMCDLIFVNSTNAVAERLKVLEHDGYILPPTKKGATDRRLSPYGLGYMKAQGYIRS